jgi:ankyrin repeat protein
MVQFMLRCGRNLNEVGFIGFSSRKRNSLVGNLICSAVYNGHLKLVDWFIQNDRNLNLEHQVQEKPRIAKGLLVKEFHKFTALMLAVAIGNLGICFKKYFNDFFLEIVKKLIESGNAKVNVHDSNKNSLLHIAVKYNAQNIVKYFLENPRDIKIFDRNHKVFLFYIIFALHSVNIIIIFREKQL